jgi:uncharacterized membrane protein YccC
MVGIRAGTAISFFLLAFASCALAQSAPGLPSQPWHSAEEQRFEVDARNFIALRRCLAASACYIIYNAIAWRGIGAPAMATCLLTAVSTVGASRQRQIVRFAAFVVGGFLIGIGSEIFILPHIDSIPGFTIFFTLVIALAAWFMTLSPRLSYSDFRSLLSSALPVAPSV